MLRQVKLLLLLPQPLLKDKLKSKLSLLGNKQKVRLCRQLQHKPKSWLNKRWQMSKLLN